MRRAIRINMLNGEFIDLELSKCTSVKTQASMINIDKMKDGTWRLIYDENLIDDFKQVKNLEIIRED